MGAAEDMERELVWLAKRAGSEDDAMWDLAYIAGSGSGPLYETKEFSGSAGSALAFPDFAPAVVSFDFAPSPESVAVMLGPSFSVVDGAVMYQGRMTLEGWAAYEREWVAKGYGAKDRWR